MEDDALVIVDIILALHVGQRITPEAFGIEEDPEEIGRLYSLFNGLSEDVVCATQNYGALESFLANHIEEYARFCTTLKANQEPS
jgi:hypothetical protein